ncbi:MAG: hypothetical protein WCY36_05015 [Candidatus Omnitrophota bacterium]
MRRYLSVIIGSCIAFIGIIGFIGWWGDFLTVLKGSIPIMLIFGGAIAVIAGLSELRDESSPKETKK